MPGIRVLIVEDSEIIQQRLMDRLAPFTGLEVIGLVQHATEAEEFIQTLKPDVVILDIRPRSGNGIDVLGENQGRFGAARCYRHNELFPSSVQKEMP